MKDVIFINSHPIQYFAPLYKYLNQHGVKTKAWYGSDESIKGGIDKQFGVEVKWDLPLLDGYEYHFFKNNSWKPSHFNGFFGLINFGMIRDLFKIPKSVIIVHGWHYFSHLLILILGKLAGHTICLRNDMPLSHESNKSGWKQKVKHIGLKYILFPRINYFLYIGNQNKLFYKSYGLADSSLIFCPYAVDNDRFIAENNAISDTIPTIKQKLGIPLDGKVIMSSAKYIEKKCPLDLLAAFKQLNQNDCWLIMVGEGELRREMEDFILEHQLSNVILTGFVNQKKISEYYIISDVFVMCSSYGENWGLSVNEAMNFDKPLVLSDLTGCADDLVIDGVNGFVFQTGNIKELASSLYRVLIEGELSWKITSRMIVKKFSFSEDSIQIKKIV